MLKFRKRTSPRVWFGIITTFLVVFLVWQFIAFQFALNKVPRDWTISGAEVAGLSYQEAIEQVEEVLTQEPIWLGYRDQTVRLQPAEIGVTFNQTATLEAVESARRAIGSARAFLTYIIRRTPPPQDIPAVVSWSDEKLRTYLAQLADQYDLRPQEPTPILDELRMAPGRSGYEVDISVSVPDVVAALKSANIGERRATLTIEEVPPPPPKLIALDNLIQASLGGFEGIAGIYVKDLSTGEEYGHNGDVAYSGMGILKTALMVAIYHQHINVSGEDTALIEQMMTSEVDNSAANALLQKLGNGDAYAGARDQLTPAMKYLGLVNTFMVTPYDQAATQLAVVTPANSRLDISTAPDPKMQTTPRDIALLLEMIYDCSRGGGALLVAYPHSFTPDECRGMLDVMERNLLTDRSDQPAYLHAGLPDEARLAHKYSWAGKVRAEAGIVFSTARDYVLVVFLYVPDAGEWYEVNPVFRDISRATYNFFNSMP